jgi:hypothetical protein
MRGDHRFVREKACFLRFDGRRRDIGVARTGTGSRL